MPRVNSIDDSDDEFLSADDDSEYLTGDDAELLRQLSFLLSSINAASSSFTGKPDDTRRVC